VVDVGLVTGCVLVAGTFAWPGNAIAVAAEKLGLTLSGRVMLGRVAYQCMVQAIADGDSLVGEATLVREPAFAHEPVDAPTRGRFTLTRS